MFAGVLAVASASQYTVDHRQELHLTYTCTSTSVGTMLFDNVPLPKCIEIPVTLLQQHSARAHTQRLQLAIELSFSRCICNARYLRLRLVLLIPLRVPIDLAGR